MLYGSDETFPAYVKYIHLMVEQAGETPFEVGIYIGEKGIIVKKTSPVYYFKETFLDLIITTLIENLILKGKMELVIEGKDTLITWGE